MNYGNITDRKSLVCIFLAGGNDGFNMFVPYENQQYLNYQAIRGEGMAIPRADLAGQQVNDGSEYAFHNSMGGIASAYNNGNIALISNVGNLRQPLTREQYLSAGSSSNVLIPEHLFAHDVQQITWQANQAPQIPIAPGWGGRLADLLSAANPSIHFDPAFSLSGANPWQSGNHTQPFSIGNTGVSVFNQLSAENLAGTDRRSTRARVFQQIQEIERQHVLEQHASQVFLETRDSLTQMRDTLALPAASGLDVSAFAGLGGNPLARDLQMIARLIAARDDLQQRRQIFFVRLGGWDTHNNQIETHANLLRVLNDAMLAFQSTMDAPNNNIDPNSVTTFTASEFGRTATSNDGGTDHGWGGHQLVMGGAVNGGQIYGSLPDLQPGGADDSGDNGRIIPTLAVDQYGATLARWLGVEDSDLNNIFPNLHMFNQRDIGFMS
jgi:uncharacterized protein (DUF1501 family)